MTTEFLDSEQMLMLLKDLVAAKQSQKSAARWLGISEQYISDMLNERREISGPVARCFGYERVVRYRRK